MFKLLSLCTIALFISGSCNQMNTSKNNAASDSLANKPAEVKAEIKDNLYGVKFDYGTSQKLTDLMADPAKLDTTKDYTVSAAVTTVCQKKGCWFRGDDGRGGDVFIKIVSDDEKGEEVGIPMTTPAGTNVIFYGTPKLRELSVKQQRHYLEDAGKSKVEIEAITKPKKEWRFMATGVMIKA